jgi:hypothetical protein
LNENTVKTTPKTTFAIGKSLIATADGMAERIRELLFEWDDRDFRATTFNWNVQVLVSVCEKLAAIVKHLQPDEPEPSEDDDE